MFYKSILKIQIIAILFLFFFTLNINCLDLSEFTDDYLCQAIDDDEIDTIAKYLNLGGDANKRINILLYNANETLLMLSVRKLNIKIAELLIMHGADVNALDVEQHSALSKIPLWMLENCIDMLKLLLDNKADPNLGNRPLLYNLTFRVKGSIKAAEILLKHNADPNLPETRPHWEKIYEYPLENAIYQDYLEMVELLLEHGAIVRKEWIEAAKYAPKKIINLLKNKFKEQNGCNCCLVS